jgi:hypothetical protein
MVPSFPPKTLALITLIIIINLSWHTLDKARTLLIRAFGLYRLKRRFERLDEKETVEGILHRVDLVRRNIAMSHFEQTGDRTELDEYYRELGIGGG